MDRYAFGVDVGGTTVKLGLFDGEGSVLDKWEDPHQHKSSRRDNPAGCGGRYSGEDDGKRDCGK